MIEKQIQQLLDSDNATLYIKDLCELRRWQTAPLGERVDRLQARFNIGARGLSEIRYREIISRDPQLILKEVMMAHTEAYAHLGEGIGEAILKAGLKGYITPHPYGWEW